MNIREIGKKDLKYYFIGKLICDQKFNEEEIYVIYLNFKRHRKEKPIENEYFFHRCKDDFYPAEKFPGDISEIKKDPRRYFIKKFISNDLLYNEEFEAFKDVFKEQKNID